LKLGNQIGRLGHVKRSRGDEQDVVGLHGAVLRAHCGAFDDRKEVTLYALPRHVGAANVAVRAHLVDLVQEDDARLFGALHRVALDLVVVDELLRFLLLENLERVGGDLQARATGQVDALPVQRATAPPGRPDLEVEQLTRIPEIL